MGAFVLFPILLFSVFIYAILGFTDFIHVDTLVHAAAQGAVQAAAEGASAVAANGIYPGTASTPAQVPLDVPTVDSTVGEMLNGQPHITGYSCSISGSQVTCTVDFTVSMPIVGTVNSQTTASSVNLVP